MKNGKDFNKRRELIQITKYNKFLKSNQNQNLHWLKDKIISFTIKANPF
jgi:hypothetical protein